MPNKKKLRRQYDKRIKEEGALIKDNLIYTYGKGDSSDPGRMTRRNVSTRTQNSFNNRNNGGGGANLKGSHSLYVNHGHNQGMSNYTLPQGMDNDRLNDLNQALMFQERDQDALNNYRLPQQPIQPPQMMGYANGGQMQQLYNQYQGEMQSRMMASGGMIPSYGMDQYGFGSWLKENKAKIANIGGKIMSGVGAGLAMTGIGAGVGAALMGAGALSSAAGKNWENQDNMDLQEEQQDKQLALTEENNDTLERNNLVKQRISEYQNGPGMMNDGTRSYGASFANGGQMSSYGQNGFMEGVKKNNNVTYFANGGTHEQNPNGGIQLGNRGLVEEGEFKVKIDGKDYIFSNRY